MTMELSDSEASDITENGPIEHNREVIFVIAPILDTPTLVISGFCEQSLPCQHYVEINGKAAHRSAPDIVYLCRKNGIEVPSHFDYLREMSEHMYLFGPHYNSFRRRLARMFRNMINNLV
jgi:hypothetical protein